CSCGTGKRCCAHWQLHAECRALTQLRPRLGPDAPAVHLNDLSRNGETESRAALGAGVRAVDLTELLEDPLALPWRYAGARIADVQNKVAVLCPSGSAHLPGTRELYGNAN